MARSKALPVGPRGGRTTRSKDLRLVRKAWLISVEQSEALRRAAFDQRRSESLILREILRQHFGLGPPGG